MSFKASVSDSVVVLEAVEDFLEAVVVLEAVEVVLEAVVVDPLVLLLDMVFIFLLQEFTE